MIPWAYNCRLPMPRTVQNPFQLAFPTWKYPYKNFLIHLTIFTEPKYFKIKSMLTLIVYHWSSSIFKTTHHSLLLIKSLTPPVATPGNTHMPNPGKFVSLPSHSVKSGMPFDKTYEVFTASFHYHYNFSKSEWNHSVVSDFLWPHGL